MNPDDTRLRSELEERPRFETPIAGLSSKFINLPAALMPAGFNGN